MHFNRFDVTCSDGHKMPVYVWQPTQPPVAVLLIAHGMAEHSLRYAAIAPAFTSEKIAVYAFDQRGHGNAVESMAHLGMVEGNWFNQQVEDINLLVGKIRAQHGSKKLFLLGHSMGSFISQRYVQLHGEKIDGLILSASNGKTDPLLRMGITIANGQAKLFGKRYRSHLIDKLSFGKFNAAFKPNRTSHDWLSRNEAEVDAYAKDPLCGFVCSAIFFRDFFKGIRAAFEEKNIQQIPRQLPVYAFSGDKDQVGYEGKGFLELIQKWKAAGLKDISYHLYKAGRHEMLNEINRDEVIQNILKWLNKHLENNSNERQL